MLVILLSNMMIFAEDDLNFPNDNRFTKPAALSTFSSQIPMLFINVSFTYGQPIIGMFYLMYTVVSESFYARVMSFSFGGSPANIKRNEGSLNIQALDENDLPITRSEDCSRQSTLSPCFFIGSLSSPPSSPSPQRPVVRKRAPSNSYMTTVEIIYQSKTNKRTSW